MSFDQEAFLTRAIAEASDAQGDVAPPWARWPEIPHSSIGWRMGYGESWAEIWHEWLARAPSDRGWRLAYLKRHAPAPRTWTRSAVSTYAPELRPRDDDGSLRAELEAAGVIADDVAIVAWERLHGSMPPAPWAGRGERLPATEFRYGARKYDFWARWCARRRAEGTLTEWLAAVGPAPTSWEAVLEAVRDGKAETLEGETYAQAAVLLAAHGLLPAPWSRGEEPAALRGQYDGEVSYTDAWSLWAGYRFDDTSTWEAYLRGQPPAPRGWAKAVKQAGPRGG
ncbi:hypothetical protein [Nannocystis bainbridge]|uniref:DUF4034 domain-containing protein n=1 Tax=Nannocystis bainbridge TaxID=2995303 RepID=A0ABT5EBY5_9BACT|nr:hypothetical protein [Nannocystis bainbridge]MDC0722418.1 hypothetical protein [Nannocystis bainbridge]